MRNHKAHKQTGDAGGSWANMGQANDLEEAAHAINAINRRTRTDAKAREEIARAKVSLSPALDAWLQKELP